MEALNLNRIPVGSNPVVHVSQYDVGRVFRFNLFDGSNVYTLDGTETIECNVRKLDGNVVTVGVTNTSSDYIDVVTTEQMTAIHGQNYGEIVFKKGGNVIGSVNFILQVEQSPLEGGITSDSAIYNLEVQVANYVAIEVANQYDSANVIFDPSPVQGHGNGYTVTSEGIGTALDTKQDLIASKSASGSLIHITDGGDNIPMKSLESEIVAVESGNGQPKSPDNPYTISGFDNGVITRCGKNLLENKGTTTTVNGVTFTVNSDGSIALSGTASANFRFIINSDTKLKSAKYTMSNGNTDLIFGISLFAVTPSGNKDVNRTTGFVTFEDSVSSVALWITSGINTNGITIKPMIELGETATTFEAYNGNTYTFTFGQTVYGGHFDNNGNLVVTHSVVDLGSLTWTYYQYGGLNGGYSDDIALDIKQPTSSSEVVNAISSGFLVKSDDYFHHNFAYNQLSINVFGRIKLNIDGVSDSATLKTALSGIMLVYPLANPITLTITSQDIPTLSGVNNIFSNCGDLDIEYFTNTVDGLVTLINDFTVENATELPISDSDPTDTKSYIDNGLSGKADTSDTYTKTEVNNLLNDKQNKNVLNIVKHYDSGTSSDAITDIITEYGKVNMVFAFDVPLGYFTGCLTFANGNMGSGFIVLSTTGRFWVVSYVSGTITLTELT